MSKLIIEELNRHGYKEEIKSVSKLSGDASSREYYRLKIDSGTVILSREPIGGLQNKDFYKTTKLFENYLKTPKIYFKSEDSTCLVQEDIGNELFQQYYVELKKEERVDILKKVIDEILVYQSISLEEFKKYSSYEFDDEKIEFEFDLANEYFVSKYLEGKITAKVCKEAKNVFLDYFRSNKNVVCHRDMHSKNIMVRNKDILNIDYQDARIGPRCYDLVSFVEDCYFDYGSEIKKQLLDYYYENSNFSSRDEFENEYSIVKCQRLFKALGSFAYLKIDRNKPSYEKYIGRTFENLRQELEKNISFEKFSQELKRAYYAN